jgi:hypothetical protein
LALIVFAGILDIFIDYFANPMTWVFTGMFILIGLLIGLFLRPWLGNQVIKFMPANHSFVDLNIDEETSISIQCKKVKGMPVQRFFKLHPGFTGIVGRFLRKPVTRYLGIEGTAYTWLIKSGRWEKLGGLGDALKTVWGEDFYSTLPERQSKMIDESRIQVTVGLDEAPLTPEGMRSISEEDIKQEEDRRASKTFWEEHGSQMKGFLINVFLAGGTGFGIALLLVMIGIIRMPVATSVPTPATNSTALMLNYLRGLIE